MSGYYHVLLLLLLLFIMIIVIVINKIENAFFDIKDIAFIKIGYLEGNLFLK